MVCFELYDRRLQLVALSIVADLINRVCHLHSMQSEIVSSNERPSKCAAELIV